MNKFEYLKLFPWVSCDLQMLYLNALGEYLEWLSQPQNGDQVVTLTPHASNCGLPKCMSFTNNGGSKKTVPSSLVGAPGGLAAQKSKQCPAVQLAVT